MCVLVALLCLLTLATSAYAECAWVLWVESPAGSYHWRLSKGTKVVFDRRAECERAAEVARDSKIAQVEREEQKSGKRLSQTERWTCLPDPVDPRAPKAK